MTARVQVEQTTTITLTLTPEDAERVIQDFDMSREPSLPGKALYSALVTAAHREPLRAGPATVSPSAHLGGS